VFASYTKIKIAQRVNLQQVILHQAFLNETFIINKMAKILLISPVKEERIFSEKHLILLQKLP